MLVSGFDTLAPTIADPMDRCKTEPVQSAGALARARRRAYMRNRATNQEKEIYGDMNETDTVEIDDTNLTSPWFLTEAAGFMGAPGRPDRLISRVAERMRRRTRPEQLISTGLFGLFRHGATAAIYLGRLCRQAAVRHFHRLQRHAVDRADKRGPVSRGGPGASGTGRGRHAAASHDTEG